MITFEGFKNRHSRIIRNDSGMFEAYLDGEIITSSFDMIEVQDALEDRICEELRESHKYECDFCNAYFQLDDVKFRIEDRTFTAPYGSTFAMGGDVSVVPVCPGCGDDLEEIR